MSVYVADMGSQNPVDFQRLAKTECAGIIHRATRSNTQLDMQYGQRRSIARAAGLLTGAYAFCTAEPAKVQSDRFLRASQLSDDESAWLDYERNSLGDMPLASALEFLDRVDQALGRYCGLYSGDRIKALIVKATDTQRDFLAKRPFWGCEYGPRWRNIDVNGHPLPWPEPFLWQFTGDGVGPQPHTLDGLENGADLSVFDGTADELKAEWAGPAIPPSPVVA